MPDGERGGSGCETAEGVGSRRGGRGEVPRTGSELPLRWMLEQGREAGKTTSIPVEKRQALHPQEPLRWQEQGKKLGPAAWPAHPGCSPSTTAALSYTPCPPRARGPRRLRRGRPLTLPTVNPGAMGLQGQPCLGISCTPLLSLSRVSQQKGEFLSSDPLGRTEKVGLGSVGMSNSGPRQGCPQWGVNEHHLGYHDMLKLHCLQ